MKKIYKRVYIVSVNSIVTGGPESLHQLASEIMKKGYETFIYYIDTKTLSVPEKFKKYGVKVCTEIEDSSDNIIITPEVHTEIFNKFKNINKVIWWLSLDYYLDQKVSRRTKNFSESRKIPTIPSYIILFICRKYKLRYFKFKEKNIYHLFNCKYVENYLNENEVSNRGKQFLCGPISKKFYEKWINLDKKQDIIIYNPKKDNTFIHHIINEMKKINQNVKFIPLKNLTEDECMDLMDISKIYIDFGNFPGPERLPREAVLRYCTIITGLEGSAGNEYDVPINKNFKIEKKLENVLEICLLINDIINNYEDYIEEFSFYRDHVINQIERFPFDVDYFLEKSNIFFNSEIK
ncbi:hypothetical protein [Vagococcus bubulae]|uniref:Glycosyl transferase family 1 domain-containing protein n=1 Tax=Vagococcus bubulae TaxID=1977868 RepID=A0A429ZM65_9ENTE|nr:hypothetical protein [Vagococcus bubulae]RST94781.1 hypothetical protein CBF36_04430 [Vagococcus bubulae]